MKNVQKSNRFVSVTIDSAIFLAFFTAALYLTGTAFYGGYLNEWGLSHALFGKSFHQTLYLASINWFKFYLISAVYLLLIIGICLLVLILFYRNLINSFKFKRLVIKLLEVILGKKYNKSDGLGNIPVIKLTLSLFYIAILFLIIIFSTYILLFYFQNEGKKSAINQRRQIIKVSDSVKNYIINAKYDNKQFQVVIIDCSDSFCAVSKVHNAKLYFMSLPNFEIIIDK